MHTPVLLKEVLEGLNIKPGAIILDGTLGGGGHSLEICKRIGPEGMLIALDRDEAAIRRTKEMFVDICGHALRVSNFKDLEKMLDELKIEKIDGAMFDLGMSSFQIEESGRGFSFQKDEPLGMTFEENPMPEKLTAKEIVNEWGEESIADVIYGFAGERYSRRIAKAIVEARKAKKIETTGELTSIIAGAVPSSYRKGRINPATKTFQALRMAVNDEVGALRGGLSAVWVRLKKEGRIAVISFHEVEDRIVKNFFRERKKAGEMDILTKKPITPEYEEVKENPRSRSAKLRIGEKNVIY